MENMGNAHIWEWMKCSDDAMTRGNRDGRIVSVQRSCECSLMSSGSGGRLHLSSRR